MKRPQENSGLFLAKNYRSYRLSLTIASILLYVIIFLLLHELYHFTGLPIFAIIPVIVIAWLYGSIPGVIASVLCFPVNMLMLTIVGISWVENMLKTGGGVSGTFGLFFIALVVGRLSDLGQRLNKELRAKQIIEEELKLHRGKLEELVLAKTVELEAKNQQLQAKTVELEAKNEQLRTSQLAMRQARDYLENLLRASPDAFIVTNADGYIVMANESVYDVYGYRPDEIIGQHAAFLTPEDEKAWSESVALVDRLFDQGSVRNWTQHRQHKDGRIIQIETGVVLLKNSDGTASGGISSSRDITEKKRLEEQLRQSQKMEAIGTLAGGIAHDFNNILGAIIGYTELSQDMVAGNSMLEKNLAQVLKAADRAKNLVQQILSFSRKTEPQLKPLQMHLIIKEALKLLRSSLPSTISILSDIDDTDDVVLADATEIHQILMNLCMNAAHAMDHRGGVIEITLKHVDLDVHSVGYYADIAPGPYMQLSVKDTGMGISADTIGRIFEPFFTTKDVGKGTGMGLAVVHGIVKKYKGDIRVYSEPGKGAVFHIVLPRVPAEEAEAHVVEREAPQGSESVLLVDDETVLLDVGKQILTSLGYRVTVVSISVEALELFRKDPAAFDMVITDQTMPQLTGYELAQQLMQVRPDIPIILCTGYSDLVTAESAIAGGIQAFVIKPLNRLAIAETIRKVLSKSAVE